MKTYLVRFASIILLVFAPALAGAQKPNGVSDATKFAGSITQRQQAWAAATTQERVQIAEAIGDEGVRTYAKAKGYEPIFDGLDRGIPQGPDQVYRAGDGVVHVFEAKGGAAQLGHAYGYPQGSAEWAVESARRVRSSAKATPSEKRAAQEVLNAASRGKMEIHVARTSHLRGQPVASVCREMSHSPEI